MEPSSIVSFGNESAFHSTLKVADGSGAGEGRETGAYELALHAMRDRCLLLQRRIHSLEHDNMRLKLETGKAPPERALAPSFREDEERLQLRRQVAELTKQKSQLMHHVLMVTCENRNLWNRIAGLRKPTKRDLEGEPPDGSPPKHARLLRTDTYIHSTPKVKDIGQEKYADSSLEEISLKLINSYIQEKSQLVEQYEQMAELQDAEETVLNLDSINFAYLDEQGSDSLKEIRNQTEKLVQLKKEVSKQEEDLMVILTNVETYFSEGRKCAICAKSQPIKSEHKEIETSDSLAEWTAPADSNTYNENMSDMTTSNVVRKKDTSPVKEMSSKANSNDHDKICPMCGQCFKKGFFFAEFQQHVENHFVGDPEPDSLADNYEIITNSVENNFI